MYKKQKNYCSKLYKKERKRYYHNTNLRNLNYNVHFFWNTVKPFLSGKGSHTSKPNLVNKDKVISDESTPTETFSKFFENAVENLGIREEINTITYFESSDPVDITLLK